MIRTRFFLDQVIERDVILGKLVASSYRQKILNSLSKMPMTPSQISLNTGINRTHVSKFLKELRDYGLVECRTSSIRKGKINKITSEGLILLKILNEMTMDNL